MKTKSLLTLFIASLAATGTLAAQNIQATTAEERSQSIEHRHQMRESSIFREYPVRNVGPVVMSGRVTDIAVHESKPRSFFIAYASGGVWETTNSGNTMQPVFDHQGTLTIGDIAISRADRDILWVGTGENNSSRSSYAGTGIYKSIDGGKTWNFSGLRGSQHIGRILTHPTDPEIAWVASQGPLYSMNEARGIYKTTDGGETWQKTLQPPDSTGVIDLDIHPDNPDKLIASTWQRYREAWNFKEGGPGSAVYLSNDGGETWQKSTEGFPQGRHVGRIGVNISRSNPDIVYAFLDNQYETKRKQEDTGDEDLAQADFVEMSKKTFLELDHQKLEGFLRRNGFPEHYSAASVKEDVRNDEYEPEALAEYLGDANEALFETDITGAEVYRSEDGGHSWDKVNKYPLDNVVFTYGYYFGEIRVSPDDPDVVYIMGVPVLKSNDGGKTWKTIAQNQPVHGDHHAMWINPNDSQHLLLGTDGGLYESHDGGTNFIHHNVAPVGQFYSIEVDMETPYNIYGGLQDNGVFSGSSRQNPDDQNYWKRIFGGDGMHVQVNPRDSDIIYTGFQFGNYFRINEESGETNRITPRHDIGEARYRYNWNSPIEMSNHNPDIIYFGSQKLNRSFDRGNTWHTISPDLTNYDPDNRAGNVPYSTLTTISESPIDFNTIWTGSDDGNVHVTKDGGTSWNLVSESLPQGRWISEVYASPHDKATAFASLNGYRYDEFETYIYKTTNYGESWTSLKGNLPEDVVNVIHQDPIHPDILYAGLDHGTFISFNGGEQWHLLNGIPNVASYDLLVHPRDLELVVGTHGRSVYVSDVKPLHKVKTQMDNPIVALRANDIRHSDSWGEREVQYQDRNEPRAEWMYWIGSKQTVEVGISVKDSTGSTVHTLTDEGQHGFNTLAWNLRTGGADDAPTYLGEGTYTIVFEVNGNTDEVEFKVD